MWLIVLTLSVGVIKLVQAESCLSESAACTCRQTNVDIASRNTVIQIDAVTAKNKCEMDIMRDSHKASNDLKIKMIRTTMDIKQMGKKSHELCQKAKMKYIPFGLEDLLPAAWECGNSTKETREFEDYSRTTDMHENRIPNVILLGATGSGKSYYGNGLLGAQDPCPPINSPIETNYFGCGKSTESVTRNVKAQYGTYFGGMYSDYGVQPMEVNIYDTPGFFDSDPARIQQNKKLIAKQLDVEIDAFIFLLGENPRISSNIQNIFSTLHEWTLGRVWNNFIVAFGRTTFIDGEMRGRAKDNKDFIGDQMAKLGEIKDKLWQIAERENWHVTLSDGNKKKMTKTDFDNVKISLLNVAQNKYCNTTGNDGQIKEDELCWKTPRREPDNLAGDDPNSFMDFLDEDTYWDYDGVFGDEYDEVSYGSDSEYFHIKNMKILQNYILEFKKHPVKTEKEEIKKDLANDIEEFKKEFKSVLKAEEMLSKMFENNDINITKCEQESKSILDDQKVQRSCPRWSIWESGECSTTCGPGQISGTRMCLDGNNQQVDVRLCQAEYKDDADYTRFGFCDKGPCDWAEWTSGQCSKNCGGGRRQYTRHCNGLGCRGNTFKEEPCNTASCEWASWAISGSCSKQCGTGEQVYTRRCTGTGCIGDFNKIEKCNTQLCEWGKWSVFQRTIMRSEVELTTTDIVKRSYIDIDNAKKAYCPKCDSRRDQYQLIYSRECLGDKCSTTDKTFDTSESIIIDCQHLEPCKWGPWIVVGRGCPTTPDSTTCNIHTQSTWSRTCLGDYCELEGPLMTGSTKIEQCKTIPCQWKSWQLWSACDRQCGTGRQSRTRECNGILCSGERKEERKCNQQKCNWSSWKESGSCSKSCGGGQQQFTRICNGQGCEGSNFKVEDCNKHRCLCATFYQHTGSDKFGAGASFNAYHGDSRSGFTGDMGWWNDIISNIDVRRGCEVEIYEDHNYNGERKTFSHDKNDKKHVSTDFWLGHWNDKITSYKCRCY